MPLFLTIALALAFLTMPGSNPLVLTIVAVIVFIILMWLFFGNIFYPILVKLGWVK
ncbi:MAG: hypothetical protein UX01_C0007G0002 [Candidatus Collierbacteria bacterium GW2011_GWB2_45_17]|uniref:Uncharacterized protein n=1 Tax=Candidatus Collierbacteria bacterium GW2011_GWB2_45_17 TaxID=1618388 RepID=A0A837IGC2_9BACT|nr:MAG: hypothetical protein UW96_C0007G0002 [Candidatus Collierbacteria bacterium GW2011_GWA1_45_15]KKU00023.1 MAG: hypothetical protein UX01_C0007G0002 [Candidatus Collierbacteria bacterium GW2011_GWB2_45_17]